MKKFILTTTAALAVFTTTQLQAEAHPEQFCFQDRISTPQETVTSNQITVSGLEKPAELKIQGSGEYLLNGHKMGRKQSTVMNGDRIQLQQKSLPQHDAKVSTTLLIGDVYDIFTVVTKKDISKEEKEENIYKTYEGLSCKVR
jgi:hypothetical protein